MCDFFPPHSQKGKQSWFHLGSENILYHGPPIQVELILDYHTPTICGLQDMWYNSLHVQPHFWLLQIMCSILTNYSDYHSHSLRNRMVRVGSWGQGCQKDMNKSWDPSVHEFFYSCSSALYVISTLFVRETSQYILWTRFADQGGNFHYFQKLKSLTDLLINFRLSFCLRYGEQKDWEGTEVSFYVCFFFF